jgi:hypothetical protein
MQGDERHKGHDGQCIEKCAESCGLFRFHREDLQGIDSNVGPSADNFCKEQHEKLQ